MKTWVVHMLNTGNMEICILQVTEGLDCYSGHDDSVSCWQITIITVYRSKIFQSIVCNRCAA